MNFIRFLSFFQTAHTNHNDSLDFVNIHYSSCKASSMCLECHKRCEGDTGCTSAPNPSGNMRNDTQNSLMRNDTQRLYKHLICASCLLKCNNIFEIVCPECEQAITYRNFIEYVKFGVLSMQKPEDLSMLPNLLIKKLISTICESVGIHTFVYSLRTDDIILLQALMDYLRACDGNTAATTDYVPSRGRKRPPPESDPKPASIYSVIADHLAKILAHLKGTYVLSFVKSKKKATLKLELMDLSYLYKKATRFPVSLPTFEEDFQAYMDYFKKIRRQSTKNSLYGHEYLYAKLISLIDDGTVDPVQKLQYFVLYICKCTNKDEQLLRQSINDFKAPITDIDKNQELILEMLVNTRYNSCTSMDDFRSCVLDYAGHPQFSMDRLLDFISRNAEAAISQGSSPSSEIDDPQEVLHDTTSSIASSIAHSTTSSIASSIAHNTLPSSSSSSIAHAQNNCDADTDIDNATTSKTNEASNEANTASQEPPSIAKTIRFTNRPLYMLNRIVGEIKAIANTIPYTQSDYERLEELISRFPDLATNLGLIKNKLNGEYSKLRSEDIDDLLNRLDSMKRQNKLESLSGRFALQIGTMSGIEIAEFFKKACIMLDTPDLKALYLPEIIKASLADSLKCVDLHRNLSFYEKPLVSYLNGLLLHLIESFRKYNDARVGTAGLDDSSKAVDYRGCVKMDDPYVKLIMANTVYFRLNLLFHTEFCPGIYYLSNSNPDRLLLYGLDCYYRHHLSLHFPKLCEYKTFIKPLSQRNCVLMFLKLCRDYKETRVAEYRSILNLVIPIVFRELRSASFTFGFRSYLIKKMVEELFKIKKDPSFIHNECFERSDRRILMKVYLTAWLKFKLGQLGSPKCDENVEFYVGLIYSKYEKPMKKLFALDNSFSGSSLHGNNEFHYSGDLLENAYHPYRRPPYRRPHYDTNEYASHVSRPVAGSYADYSQGNPPNRAAFPDLSDPASNGYSHSIQNPAYPYNDQFYFDRYLDGFSLNMHSSASGNAQYFPTNGHAQYFPTNGHAQYFPTNGHAQYFPTNGHAQYFPTNDYVQQPESFEYFKSSFRNILITLLDYKYNVSDNRTLFKESIFPIIDYLVKKGSRYLDEVPGLVVNDSDRQILAFSEFMKSL